MRYYLVPEPDDPRLAFEAQGAERRRVEGEQLALCRIEAEPARCQNAQHVSMREEKDVASRRLGICEDPIDTGSDLLPRTRRSPTP